MVFHFCHLSNFDLLPFQESLSLPPSGAKSCLAGSEVLLWHLIQTRLFRLSFLEVIKGPVVWRVLLKLSLFGLKCNQRTIPTASSLPRALLDSSRLLRMSSHIGKHNHFPSWFCTFPMAVLVELDSVANQLAQLLDVETPCFSLFTTSHAYHVDYAVSLTALASCDSLAYLVPEFEEVSNGVLLSSRKLSVYNGFATSGNLSERISLNTSEPVPSSCTGRFHYEDGIVKNQATVLAAFVPLHWPVPLRCKQRCEASLSVKGVLVASGFEISSR
ncbi:hypothetical protein Tco_0527825 [Tanacetum coccineum]